MTTSAPDVQAAAAHAVEPPAAIVARSPLQLFWLRLRRDRVALAALAFIVVLLVCAALAPLIVKVVGGRPPNVQSTDFLSADGLPLPPGADAPFGTDPLGRDVFARTVYGARTSLQVALLATLVTMVVGVTAGMLAAYYRGWVDTVLARTMDVMLAFPVLLLAIGLGAACSLGNGCLTLDLRLTGGVLIAAGTLVAGVQSAAFLRRRRRIGLTGPARPRQLAARCVAGGALALIGLACLTVAPAHGTLIQPGVPVLVFVLSLGGIPYVARIIRGQALSLREREFVEAARALGASDARIVFRHLLPNLVAPIVVYTTLLIPANILFEAALSFLGVGVQPPTASWGAMISDAVGIFNTAWWYMTFPGLALLLAVLAFNLVGDGLQDALNRGRGA